MLRYFDLGRTAESPQNLSGQMRGGSADALIEELRTDESG